MAHDWCHFLSRGIEIVPEEMDEWRTWPNADQISGGSRFVLPPIVPESLGR
jgi:hypothetical protein